MNCLVFPGQGSQHIGMCADVIDNYGRDIFQCINDIANNDILHIINHGTEEELKQTEYSQLAIFGVSVACLHAFMDINKIDNINNFGFAGHSVGEYAALYAAGIINLEQAVTLLFYRSNLMSNCSSDRDAGMVAVLGFKDTIYDYITNSNCYLSCINTANQIVIGGYTDDLDAFIDNHGDQAKRFIKLAVSGAFHTPLMSPAKAEYQKKLHDILPNEDIHNGVGYYSNVTAKVEKNNIQHLLAEQLVSTVLWHNSVMQMIDDGYNNFVEIGPGKVLHDMIAKNPGINVSIFNKL